MPSVLILEKWVNANINRSGEKGNFHSALTELTTTRWDDDLHHDAGLTDGIS